MKKSFSVKSILFSTLLVIVMTNFACKKESQTKPIETGTVTDIDNNLYRTVKIGDQWWMAEDLRTSRYRNGVSISTISVTDNLFWANDTIGSLSPNENNSDDESVVYNWYAVHNINQLAPEGWHIPTDQDWKILEAFLGMTNEQVDKTGWRGGIEGDKLKITGEENWQKYGQVWATNEFDFSALASGCRLYNGSWSTPLGNVYMGFWWTASEHSTNEVWYRYLDYKRSEIFRSHILKSYGLNVRCIKD